MERNIFTITDISIHAPRGGSDALDFALALLATISIHAPRGGSDELRQT